MALGSGIGNGSGLPVGAIAVSLVAGLILGYLAAMYLVPGASGSGAKAAFTKLSDEDKNFLVTVANAQIDLTTRLTAQQSATLDWCTAGGGQWLTSQRPTQVTVTPQQAQQLQQQGAQVVQAQDGNFLATVVLFDRSSCVVVPTRGG